MAEMNTPQLPLAGVPVGTILPYAGPLNVLEASWQPCDGRQIADPASPFNGKRLPNLMNARFLMGVAAADAVLEPGGTNELKADGGHGHGGETDGFRGYQQGETNYNQIQGHQSQYMIKLGIRGDGNHNHGGENRPSYFGVYFIMRIK